MKKCSKCNEEKIATLDWFPSSKVHKNGLSCWCRICTRKYNSIYSKRYAMNNKVKLSERNKQYRKDNHERYQQYSHKYIQKNKKKIQMRARELQKKRRKDYWYRLHQSLSAQIRYGLKNNKNGYHWESLVGYTLKDLIKHLERQFTENMSWDNYGQWHLDHIIPVSVFNFSSPEHIDFKRCWALKNLRPLWAKENMSKGNKILKPFQPSLEL